RGVVGGAAAAGGGGAGGPPKPTTTFCTVDESFTAYGLLDHRHTPEIEQTVGRLAASTSPAGRPDDDVSVLFTPHLAPMSRGILATCYARPAVGATPGDTAALLERYRAYYADAPFVTVIDGSPATKSVTGSNSAHVTVRHDERTGWLVALCAIDNLVKGASGQAVQCANRLCGLPETTGLPLAGLFP
ncbi:MAG: hypothetical protein JJU45_09720, partial [Acidimicrobiia bacterium]|nr:hypothetical protein [Acidimicrobiia bacterium]